MLSFNDNSIIEFHNLKIITTLYFLIMKYILPDMNLQDIRNSQNLLQEQVADKLGIGVSTYSKIERGLVQLTVKRLLKLSSLFNMSPNEILNYKEAHQAISTSKYGGKNIIYLPGNRQEMLLSGCSEDIDEEAIYFDLPVFRDKDMILISIEDDSMYPTFSTGDFILIKKTSLSNIVRWDMPYLIVVENHAFVKRLYKSKVEQKLRIKSDTESCEPYEMDLSIVKALWEVMGKISKNLRLISSNGR